MIEILSYICFGIGTLIMLISILGIYRFPDVFSRSHAAGMIDSGSTTFILLGCILLTGFSLVTLKIVFIWFFLLITCPSATHAMLKAAIVEGEKPISWEPEK